MANNAEKDLLSLIRGFTSERHQGERRLVDSKKRIDELNSELDREYEEFENAKRRRESIEQELKGYETELAIKEASVQSLEARISPYQDQISAVKSDLQSLKNEEEVLRDEFIKEMLELNAEIRRSLALMVSSPQTVIQGKGLSEKDESTNNDQDPEVAVLRQQISSILSQITAEERECEEERNRNVALQQELSDAKRKLNLLETVMEDMKELQDLTKQTSELEVAYSELGEELQKRCECPSCHRVNIEGLEDIFQGMTGISQNTGYNVH